MLTIINAKFAKGVARQKKEESPAQKGLQKTSQKEI